MAFSAHENSDKSWSLACGLSLLGKEFSLMLDLVFQAVFLYLFNLEPSLELSRKNESLYVTLSLVHGMSGHLCLLKLCDLSLSRLPCKALMITQFSC